MVKLIDSFSRFKKAHVLVVGDFMLDMYTTGSVERISPEAPVPILHVKETEYLPGGAGNVALNLKALGACVTCMGRIGLDFDGKQLKNLLASEEIDIHALFVQEDFRTPVKNRLIAGSQQLIRIDDENIIPIAPSTEKKGLDFIKSCLENIQVIAISDYGKGFLSKKLLKTLIEQGRKKNIPVIIDPKGDDFSNYEQATAIKPNLKEATQAAKLGSKASLNEIGEELLSKTNVDSIIITRSEEGISLFDKNKRHLDFPVKSREVVDVTGAGDTVLAILSMGYAARVDLIESLQLANIAAGMAIERLGCARISLSDIAERLLETDIENKVFDGLYLFTLNQALKNKKLTILVLSSNQELSSALFAQIQKLASEDGNEKLMLYLKNEKPDEHLLTYLSSLHEVDYIVIKSESLSTFCETINPTHVYLFEEEKLLPINQSHILVGKN